MIICGIYKITSPTGKVYVGQSKDMVSRERDYANLCCKEQILIYNSLLKYGWDAHKWDICHVLPKDISQDIVDEYEVLYHDLYKSCGVKMLNLREPGRRGRYAKESREKLSKSLTGRIFSEEHRRKLGLVNKGRVFTEERKRNLRESKKDISQEARDRMSVAQKGRRASVETKLKLSTLRTGEGNSFYGKTHTEEARSKISKGNMGNQKWVGKKHREESKIKMSETKRLIREDKMKSAAIIAIYSAQIEYLRKLSHNGISE